MLKSFEIGGNLMARPLRIEFAGACYHRHSGHTYDLTIRFRMLFEECLKKSVPSKSDSQKAAWESGKRITMETISV